MSGHDASPEVSAALRRAASDSSDGVAAAAVSLLRDSVVKGERNSLAQQAEACGGIASALRSGPGGATAAAQALRAALTRAVADSTARPSHGGGEVPAKDVGALSAVGLSALSDLLLLSGCSTRGVRDAARAAVAAAALAAALLGAGGRVSARMGAASSALIDAAACSGGAQRAHFYGVVRFKRAFLEGLDNPKSSLICFVFSGEREACRA
jgi:hypothetical protein